MHPCAATLPSRLVLLISAVSRLLLPGVDACGFSSFDALPNILKTCCETAKFPLKQDCSKGFPNTCTLQCAKLLVPFYNDCGQMMKRMPPGNFKVTVEDMKAYVNHCEHTQELYHYSTSKSCATNDNEKHMRVLDVTASCCSQNGKFICETGSPWQCDAECAVAFVPFFDDCLRDTQLSTKDLHKYTVLYERCANLNDHEVGVLMADLNTLVNNPKCFANTSGVHARGSAFSATTVKPAGEAACEDDDAKLAKLYGMGFTCLKAASSSSGCGMTHVSDVCSCACKPPPEPEPSPSPSPSPGGGQHRRNQVRAGSGLVSDPGYQTRVSEPVPVCESSPCLNGATCINSTQTDTYICNCTAGYNGAECDNDISPGASLVSTGLSHWWTSTLEFGGWLAAGWSPTVGLAAAPVKDIAEEQREEQRWQHEEKQEEDEAYRHYTKQLTEKFDGEWNPNWRPSGLRNARRQGYLIGQWSNPSVTKFTPTPPKRGHEEAGASKYVKYRTYKPSWTWLSTAQTIRAVGWYNWLTDTNPLPEEEADDTTVDIQKQAAGDTVEVLKSDSHGTISDADDHSERRRNQVSGVSFVHGNPHKHITSALCKWDNFDNRLAAVDQACCADAQSCVGSVPNSCTFDCGRIFATFIRDCGPLFNTIIVGGTPGTPNANLKPYYDFLHNCKQLDPRSLATAVHDTQCAECGNGRFEPWWHEECDTGSHNANKPNTCRPTCKQPRCGDGIVDKGEQCDAGDAAFSTKCTAPWTESGLMQWTRGKTTSPESMGATKAQGGSWFMFLETKPQEDKYHTSIKPGDQGPSKPHISYLHSPVSRPIQTLSFYYHMHGTAMGTLSVEARQHKGPGHDEWKIVWSKKGQQQASASAAWAHAAMSMPSGTTQLRFVGVAGGNRTTAMAVDQVSIKTGGSGQSGDSTSLSASTSFEDSQTSGMDGCKAVCPPVPGIRNQLNTGGKLHYTNSRVSPSTVSYSCAPAWALQGSHTPRKCLANGRWSGPAPSQCTPPNCFAAETLIKMADGTSKPIHKVEPGDACAGGVVISTMKFAFDPAHDVLYDVDGIRVAGAHAVKNAAGTFVRVHDLPEARELAPKEQGDVRVLYDLITSNNRIFIDRREFADYTEVHDTTTDTVLLLNRLNACERGEAGCHDASLLQ